MNRIAFASSLLFGLSALASSGTASAQALDACQGIAVSADATCEVRVTGGCTTECTPISFRAACSADLWASCDGGCTGSASAACNVTCISACQTDCMADPGSFDCLAECQLGLTAACSAQCSDAGDADALAECNASCTSTFRAECNASCEATPPSANCNTRCQASCDGACTAQASLSCQVDCQAGGYADCYTSLEGGCMTQCEDPSGALFCDGQYVNVRRSVRQCIDELRRQLNIRADVSATGSASCDGGTCTATGTISAGGCSVSPARDDGSYAWSLLALGLLAIRRKR